MSRIAVVLFNLGGPDGPEAVEPFLFNLFNDPAIIGAPGLIRRWLAGRVSRKRAPLAREIYAHLGGGSPLLANTEAQAAALQTELAQIGDVRVFIAMRYWHPMSDATAAEVKAFAPDRIVLLPLYPQYSTTTTGSSLADWHRAAAKAGLAAPTRALCCYPTAAGFIAAAAARTAAGIEEARQQAADSPVRILFSAHGLPERVINKGDPYAEQIGRTARAIADALDLDDAAWRVCFQSRVGPLKWIGPYTDAEITAAAREGVSTVVVPVAFVSEHSETLVELDIEYRKLATDNGMPAYVRVPTVDTDAAFIGGLGDLVRQVLESEQAIQSQIGGRLCPADRTCCAQAMGA
jgi:ferrochelatase